MWQIPAAPVPMSHPLPTLSPVPGARRPRRESSNRASPTRTRVTVTTAKTARWLDLIAYLLGHHFPVTREDIYRNVRGYLSGGGKRAAGGAVPDRESARRKFERDKD